EYSKTSFKITIFLLLISTITLILLFINILIPRIIGFLLLYSIIFLSLWQGSKIQYDKIDYITKQSMYNFITYGNHGDLKSKFVDTSSYYSGNSGLAAWYDKQLQIDKTKIPLNGRVYYPQKKGTYPLILVVHGNHLLEERSDLGYDYLLKNFAANNFVAISIDENFFNGNWTTLGQGMPYENDARGLLLIEHLKFLKEENSNINSPLYNLMDFENIGLTGHSRGGEAISIAASKNREFKIKGIFAIAPTDRQYRENIYLKDISFMAIHGANDGDLTEFYGRSQFNRTSFSGNSFNFKISTYIEGVNHAQFNSDWGVVDSTSLGKIFKGKNNNIRPIDQQNIAKVLSLSFFESCLKNDLSQIPKLQNPAKYFNSIPKIHYIVDYIDSNYIDLYLYPSNELITYDNMSYNIENHRYKTMISVEWDSQSSMILNNHLSEYTGDEISISLANKGFDTINFQLKLYLNNIEVDSFNRILLPGIKKNIFKFNILNKKNIIEPNFQSFKFQYTKWDKMELIFFNKGSILIDNISLTSSQKTE
ncbi:MAG: hypothetical protein JXR64_05025, partial [Spirochaetales bacterium]|nr:hypothetical protein [Spirochaetales bacterium]